MHASKCAYKRQHIVLRELSPVCARDLEQRADHGKPGTAACRRMPSVVLECHGLGGTQSSGGFRHLRGHVEGWPAEFDGQGLSLTLGG